MGVFSWIRWGELGVDGVVRWGGGMVWGVGGVLMVCVVGGCVVDCRGRGVGRWSRCSGWAA